MNTCRPQPVSAEIGGETKLTMLIMLVVKGRVPKKKRGKSMVFCHTRGWGVSEGSENAILLFWGLKKGKKWPKMALK